MKSDYTITKTVNYNGRTTPVRSYVVTHKLGRNYGTFNTLKEAKAEVAMNEEVDRRVRAIG